MRTANRDQRWSATKPYLQALLILLGSRLVVLSSLIFSARLVPPSPLAAGESGLAWYQYLLRWDAGWYLRIIREGYSFNGDDSVQQAVVFHPLYPLVSKGVHLLSGLPEGLSLVIVANLSIFIAVPLLFKLIREDYGDETALGALAALCFFPSSLFFSTGYTESLTLLLIVLFFLALKKGRFVAASVWVGLALATRPTSVVLLLPLFWELWRAFSKDLKRLLKLGGTCLVLATSGLWLYMLYLWVAFGHPLAFLTNHRAWNGAGSWGEFFRVLTLQPFQHLADLWSGGLSPLALAPWFFLLFVLLLIFFKKLLPASYSLYTLGALLMPYIISSGNEGFRSFTRYLLLVFPIFLVMGEICKKQLWLGLTVLGLFAALLFMHTAFYAEAYWAG